MHRPSGLWLCLPPVVMALIDLTLTLTGQSSEYWAGDYHLAEEANPLARPFLIWSPFVFLGLGLIWVLAFSAFILLAPRWTAVFTSVALTFSHSVGSSTWLWRLGPQGIILTIIVFVVAERLVDLSWKRIGIFQSKE